MGATTMLEGEKLLTTTQVAELLGVSSINTIKNWLEGGYFPGATQTRGGHWRFQLSEVLAVKEAQAELARKNAMKLVTAADFPEMSEEDFQQI